jgi:hypothetical protein
MSWVLIILTILVHIVGLGNNKDGFFPWALSKMYSVCITAFFIKFMFVSFAELGIHDVFIPQPWFYRLSYFTSLIVINIYCFELMNAWTIVKKRILPKDYPKYSQNIQITHFEYTKYMHPDRMMEGNTMLVKDKIRWFVIFILISSL